MWRGFCYGVGFYAAGTIYAVIGIVFVVVVGRGCQEPVPHADPTPPNLFGRPR